MNKIRVFCAFSGYDSQCLALRRLGIPFELVGWSEIDKYAIQAHDVLFPEAKDRNYGDISKINWEQVPDFDLFTYSFPCFIAGTLVLTKNGYKPIEDVGSGDCVLTHTCNFRNVVKPMRRKYSGVVYNLTCPIFNDLTCTENHPLYVRRLWRRHDSSRAFDAPQWLSPREIVSDLTSDRKPRTRRYYIGYAINKEANLPVWDGCIDNRWGHYRKSDRLSSLFVRGEFWYLMGRYVGDGWKRTGGNGGGIIICCGGRNEKRLVDSLNAVGWHFNVVHEQTVRKYIICMNELSLFVDRYGYYAYGKHIDYETLCLPIELLRIFMEGMMESDGCFTQGLYKISSVSKELIYGLGQCVAKVYNRPFSIYKTLRPKKVIIESRTVNQKDSWTISWKMTQDKQDKSFYEDGYIWAPLNRIEWSTKSCEVYNMEVEADNSYTANGAIVHNCTDISNAGQQKGLEKGSGTRSSLLWECEKAIRVKRPKYLLMENVSALVSQKFLPYYEEWRRLLVSLGYESWSKVLNATDYEVPQNRERIFMVSILGGGSFYFPEPMPLNRCLGDVLEEDVDEKYFLSDKMVDFFITNTKINKERGNGFQFNPSDGNGIGKAITTKSECRMDDNFIKVPICLNSKVNGKQPSLTDRVYSAAAAATAVTTGFHPAVLTPRRNAYGKAVRKDYESGIVKEKRGNMTDLVPREDGLSNTITTVQKDNLLYIPQMCIGSAQKNAYKGSIKGPSPTITAACGMGGGQTPMVILQRGRGFNKGGVKEICPTISTSSWQHNNMVLMSAENLRQMAEKSRGEEIGVTIDADGNLRPHRMDKAKSGVSEYQTEKDTSVASTLISARPNNVYGESTDYRIRKLTPRECLRLMDVDDSDIDKLMAAGISNTQLYKMAGNSIVVNVLYHIFRKMFVNKENENIQLTLF